MTATGPPVFLPNWTGTSLTSLPISSDSWFFDPSTVPDFGGSGFWEDGISGARIVPKCRSRLPIRCHNGINSALFLTAVAPQATDILSPNSSFNHNQLIFHPPTRSILCKSGSSSVTLCTLQQVLDHQDHQPLSHQVRVAGPSEKGIQFVRPYSLPHQQRNTSALELIDIQKHQTTDQVILNCVSSIITGDIVQDGPAADFVISSQIPAPTIPKNANIVFVTTSPFPGMEHEITAIVRSNVNSPDAESALDHMMIFDCRSQRWRRTGKTGADSGVRCMYASQNHPRQVLVSDSKSFRMCDHRVSESSTASLIIFSSDKNAHLFPFEEIMSGASFSTDAPHQHLLLSDMHVNVVDERFPGSPLLQMAHCMESRTGTRLSRIRCQEMSFAHRKQDEAADVLVLVSNEHCICLMCLSPMRGVRQPQLSDSAVHSFHLNDFPDALSFSGYDSSRMSRPRDLCIAGWDLIPPAASGGSGLFSLVAVTRNCDLFLQDLDLLKDKTEDRSGTFFSTQTDASLNPQTAEYLNYSIFNISSGMRSEDGANGRSANSSKHPAACQPCKHSPQSCKCCQEWHFRNSIADLHTDTQSAPQQPPHSSLFLDKLKKFAPLFEQTAAASADQTEEHEGLPVWNLLTHNLLHAWSLSSQVEVVNQRQQEEQDRRSS